MRSIAIIAVVGYVLWRQYQAFEVDLAAARCEQIGMYRTLDEIRELPEVRA